MSPSLGLMAFVVVILGLLISAGLALVALHKDAPADIRLAIGRFGFAFRLFHTREAVAENPSVAPILPRCPSWARHDELAAEAR